MTIMWCVYWNMEYEGQNFLSFWTVFCPFTSPLFNNPKNQNFVKIEKPRGYIIILHRCDLNENHMMYGFWNTECDRQKFLSFWTIFWTFTTLTTQKIKILKKMKQPSGDVITLHMCTVNENGVQQTNFFVILDCFLPFYPLTT